MGQRPGGDPNVSGDGEPGPERLDSGFCDLVDRIIHLVLPDTVYGNLGPTAVERWWLARCYPNRRDHRSQGPFRGPLRAIVAYEGSPETTAARTNGSDFHVARRTACSGVARIEIQGQRLGDAGRENEDGPPPPHSPGTSGRRDLPPCEDDVPRLFLCGPVGREQACSLLPIISLS
jgi:hypothetical protein